MPKRKGHIPLNKGEKEMKKPADILKCNRRELCPGFRAQLCHVLTDELGDFLPSLSLHTGSG